MNNKKLIFGVLLLFVILTLGCVSAAPDDNTTSTQDAQVLSTDENQTVVSDPSDVTITNDMDNSAIQQAIDGAEEGSTVNFENGTYSNINLIVNKTLTLNGNGATLEGTPNPGNRWNGIFTVMNCNNTKVTGFNFVCIGVNGTVKMNTPSTLIVFNTTNTTIENNTATGGRFGIAITSNFSAPNYYAVVRNNTVYDALDAGIQSFGSAYTLIANNTIINSGNHGIDVRHGTGPNCTVVNNTIIGGKEGIYIMHSAGHTVVNNTIYNTTICGLTAYGASNTYFDYNAIHGPRIGYMLAMGYSNITIGENNVYDLDFVPMTPTFVYYIVTDSSMNGQNGTFTDPYYNLPYTNIQFDDLTRVNGSSENSTLIIKLWHDTQNVPLSNQTLYVTIDDNQTYTLVTDDSGAVYVNVENLTVGSHKVYASYNGTQYDPSNKTGYVNVISNEGYLITVSDLNMSYKDGSKVVLTLTKDGLACANQTVIISVLGKNYTRTTNENGQASLDINLKPGTYQVTGIYNNIQDQAKLIVNKNKVTYSSVTKTVKRGNQFSVKVLDKNGNPVVNQVVRFCVLGKFYYKTTDANGVARLTIRLKPGNYKIAYSLTSHDYYYNGKMTQRTTFKVTA